MVRLLELPRFRLGLSVLAALACACTDSAGDDEIGDETEASADAGSEDSESSDTESDDATGSTESDTESESDTDTDSGTTDDPGDPYPAPDAWGGTTGPGGPAVAFAADDLYQNCAFLDGGADDTTDHHNLVVMFDGLLMMPWAPEWGGGGLTFFDISDPCAPQAVGYGTSSQMRETHATGFAEVDGSWYAVVDGIEQPFLGLSGGLQMWDVSNTASPQPVTMLELPGFLYPDAYARVTLSVFYQAPWIYAAGADNGVYIIDASDPTNPVLAEQINFNPTHRAGQVQVIGNLMMVTAAEGPRTVMLDVSVPDNPQPIAGGDFGITDSMDQPRESYFSNWSGGYGYYAIKDGGGGLIVYDLHDPGAPVFAGEYPSGGNGGYVFAKDQYAVVGESSNAKIYDLTDLDDIQLVAVLDLEGDLDTATPIGNVIFLSVDDEANPNEGTGVAPFLEQPDGDPPFVTFAWPADGATGLSPRSRFGVSFNEMVEPRSAFEGSVRLYETDTDPAQTRVDGWISTQENIVNFAPESPLSPATSYTLEIPAGGIVDYNGNPIEVPFLASFTTAG